MASRVGKWMKGNTEKGKSEEKLRYHESERPMISLSKYLVYVYKVLGGRYSSESHSYRPALQEIMTLASHIRVDFCFSRNPIKV